MKRKFVICLMVVNILILSACQSQEVIKDNQELPTSVMTIEEPIEVESTEILEVETQQQSEAREKKTLKDIVLSGDYSSSYDYSSELTEESTMESSTEEISTEQVSEGESKESESTVEEADYSWDEELYKNIGVHAVTLDDWYKYKHTDVTVDGKVCKYIEVSEDDSNKQLVIEMAKNEFSLSSSVIDFLEEIEIKGTACQAGYDADHSRGELLYAKNGVYYKFSCVKMTKTEFLELITHIITYS